MLGLYKYSRTKDGNVDILNGELTGNALNSIFSELRQPVIDKVAHYTNNTIEFTSLQMEKIAREAIRLVRENLKGKATDDSVTHFLSDQRHNILTCLPAELQLGDVLHDNTIDDRTNKMEGPISGVMHWVEKLFSGSDRKKEENF